LLAQQAGHPGFSRLRVPRHQQVAASDGQGQWLPVVGVPEQEVAAGLQRHRDLTLFRESPDVTGNSRGTVAGQHVVGGRLQGLTAPGHRHPGLTRAEQFVIVLCVADGYRVVRRQSQNGERFTQAGRLADGLRQHHHPAAIE